MTRYLLWTDMSMAGNWDPHPRGTFRSHRWPEFFDRAEAAIMENLNRRSFLNLAVELTFAVNLPPAIGGPIDQQGRYLPRSLPQLTLPPASEADDYRFTAAMLKSVLTHIGEQVKALPMLPLTRLETNNLIVQIEELLQKVRPAGVRIEVEASYASIAEGRCQIVEDTEGVWLDSRPGLIVR